MSDPYCLAGFIPEAFSDSDPGQKEIYGRVVVIKDFIRNLISHGSYPKYEFYEHIDPLSALRGSNPHPLSDLAGHDKTLGLKRIDYLKQARSNFNFDIWHDVNGELSNALSLRERFSPVQYPISATFHCLSYHFLLHEWFLDILLKAPKPYDTIVCTSTSARRALHNQFNHIIEWFSDVHGVNLSLNVNTTVIPLGVDTGKFKPGNKSALRIELNLPRDAFIILWIGRISPIDKADLLPTLVVLRELLDDHPQRDIRLVIGGDGEDVFIERITSCIVELGLSDNVLLVRPLAPENRHLYHAAADVFISPADNIQETFGITPIEAMACGVPQVVADWDGYRDTVVDGETGFLIPTYVSHTDEDICMRSGVYDCNDLNDHFEFAQSIAMDPGAYKQALETLLEHDEILDRMGKASRQRALQHYSWPVCIRQYEHLWHSQIELMRSSDGLDIPAGRPYGVPKYFESFHHYATKTIDHSTTIALSHRGQQVALQNAKLNNYYAEFNSISEPLLKKILVQLLESNCTSIGALMHHTDVVGFSDNLIFRHIMWLKKYHFIQFGGMASG